LEATVATSKLPVIPFPAQTSALPLTISAEQISKYAEITSLLSEIEAQKDRLRAELLTLHAAGAEQEETSPYLLNFIEQQRRTVDWKNHALALAAKVYGLDKVATWQAEVEQATPVTPITQIRVKPNAVFAAGITPKKPATSERRPQ
jgi:hypothetical protein